MAPTENPRSQASRRPWVSVVLALLGVGAASGVFSLVSLQHQTSVVQQPRTTAVQVFAERGGAPFAEATRAPTAQTGAGDVLQDNSNTVVLFQKVFKAEVLRRSRDLPPAKADIRDRMLDIVGRLLAVLAEEPPSAAAIEALSAELAAAIDAAPVSSYRLTAREFTLNPGTAHFLPGGQHVLAFLGPQDPADPASIAVKRDGRKANMTVGTIHRYPQQGRICKLLLHEVAPEFRAATFSFDCSGG